MKILLVRPGFKNLMSGSNVVTVEPLDLEYLAAICGEEGVEYEIYDGQIARHSFKQHLKRYQPDLVAITGYITMVPTMRRYVEMVKQLNPATKVLIGGAHAELNFADFYWPETDWVAHSGGVETFRNILSLCVKCCERTKLDESKCEDSHSFEEHSQTDTTENSSQMSAAYMSEICTDQSQIPGICYKTPNGEWVCNECASFDPERLPLPDRTHFYANRRYFKYMRYQSCAVVKTTYGCPYNCNFCYCCLMNNGKYAERSMESVVAEIGGLDSEYIWIVDDTFLVNRERVLEFARRLKVDGIQRKFIIYSRADFIAKNEDLLPVLKEVGVVEVIVGLEAVDDEKLQDYNKHSSAELNRKCVENLNRWGLGCVGLFMVDIDAGREDFRRIVRWVKVNKLRYFLTSIFTPFPGTKLFERYQDQLTTTDYEKWDLLHLVLRPTRLHRWVYYWEFYKLYWAMIWLNLRAGDFSWNYFFNISAEDRTGRSEPA